MGGRASAYAWEQALLPTPYSLQPAVPKPKTMPLLPSIHSPADLKAIPREQLPELAQEIRTRLIECVSLTGGHIGASLGTVELAIALLYEFDSPHDKILWDVGHQAYAWKLLTGRKGDPLLTMNRTAFDDSGRAVEFGSHAYRPELYTFEMTFYASSEAQAGALRDHMREFAVTMPAYVEVHHEPAL